MKEKKQKKSYGEQVKENMERITGTPDFRRRSYSRMVTGPLVILFTLILLPIMHFSEKLFHISAYAVGIGGLVVVTALAIIIGEKITNKKFGDK